MVKLSRKNWIIIASIGFALLLVFAVSQMLGSNDNQPSGSVESASEQWGATGDASEDCLAQGNASTVCACRIEQLQTAEHADLFNRYQTASDIDGADEAFLDLTEIEQIQILDTLKTVQIACPPGGE